MRTTNYPPQVVRAALLTARLAAQQRHTATTAYRDALTAAHKAGCTYSELAAIVGCTRQAIRQYINTN